VVVVGAEAKKPVNGLPKKQKMQVGCPHILVCKENGTKRYVGLASADSTELLLRQSPFASGWLSAFRNPGVPRPTSKLSPRALAQMGRRETEREGGRKPEGDGRERWNPAAFVFVPRPGRVRLQ
jgi:hypothetical protein